MYNFIYNTSTKRFRAQAWGGGGILSQSLGPIPCESKRPGLGDARDQDRTGVTARRDVGLHGRQRFRVQGLGFRV